MHDDVINNPAKVTGDQPKNHAHQQGEYYHQTADQQRQTRTVHQAGQHVAAYIISTKQMRHGTAVLPRGRSQQRIAELVCRVVGCEDVGKDRNQDHHHNVHQPNNRTFVAFKIVPELLQRSHRHRCSNNFIFSNL